ncbi:MAG TPA: sigma-70 family RNA polymerase sigma factor [Anaerolineales bacterium]|nr:sigma-70 family RNA polymerase sigma factor [Anaerolineales bacterium]
MDEQEAIRRLKSGDIGGLEMLVRQYQVRAVRTAFLITHDAAQAEDVVQDAFLQAFRSIRHFDQNRSFAAWFMRNVINTAVKAAQKGARRASVQPASDDPDLENWLASEGSLEQQVETSEFQQRVWEALQKLSPRQRAVIVQRYFLDASEREIAADLKAAPGTVKWLLHAARKNLHSLLSERTEK